MNFRSEYIFFVGVWLLLAVLLLFNLSDVFVGFLILRFFAGLVVVGYIPGYFLQTILFPRQAYLTSLERFALSIGLSLVLIPPIALVLENFSFGFRAPVLMVTLGIVSAILGLFSWVQRLRVPKEERYGLFGDTSELSVSRVRVTLPSRLYLVVIVLLGVALIAGVTSAILPKPDTLLTEFYILDNQGSTAEFPKQVRLGDTVTLEFGIVNREDRVEHYRVDVLRDDQHLVTSPTMDLQNGESVQQSISFKLDVEGKVQQIQFNLYRDEDTMPYRKLHLWVDVVPA